MIRTATDYEELAFFALAQVPVPRSAMPAARAASLQDTQTGKPATEATRAFGEDRAALAALAPSGILPAQFLPRLFTTIADFTRTWRSALGDLSASDVASAAALSALRGGDARLAELLACDMALSAAAFAAAEGLRCTTRTAHVLPHLETALAQLAGVAPALGDAEVVLTSSLGRAGRAFVEDGATIVYVGVTSEDVDEAGARGAVLALHELATTFASEDYAIAERAAIESCRILVDATAFAGPLSRMLERLDLSSLASPDEASSTTHAVLARLTRSPS